MNVSEKAKMFACAAHNGARHKRKVSGEPYISHPKAVAAKTRYFFERLNIKNETTVDNFVAVAWLHDTVEDTGIEMEDIKDFFDSEVYLGVMLMTDPKTPGIDRATRNLKYNEQLGKAPFGIQVVKLADIDANFEDIVSSHRNSEPEKQFKNFERFIAEKRNIIVNYLTQVNDTDIAQRILEKFDAFLALKKSQAYVDKEN